MVSHAKLLYTVRQRERLSQARMAERLGVSRAFISSVERGKRLLPAKRKELLREYVEAWKC